MSAQHTPGFWATDFGVTRVEVFDEAGRIIATLPRDAEYGRPHAVTAANAHLIAAAPDMLQALRRAAIALAFASEGSEAMQDDYNAAIAAISKATGDA